MQIRKTIRKNFKYCPGLLIYLTLLSLKLTGFIYLFIYLFACLLASKRSFQIIGGLHNVMQNMHALQKKTEELAYIFFQNNTYKIM
jgi:hypothetical protein